MVSQYFWPENFRINDLVEEWLARGHEVTVLTGKPNYPDGKTFEAYRINTSAFSRFGSANVHRAPMLARGSGALRLMLNYISFVAGACAKGPWALRHVRPDVIFVFEPSPITVGLPAVLLGRLKRCPVVFWALVPVAVVTIAMTVAFVPESRDPGVPPLDLPGLAVSVAALGLLTYTIIEAPDRGWTSARTLGGFAVAAALVALFVVLERRAAHPMLDVTLFVDARFSAA